MTLNIYSGKDAYINDVPCLINWQVTPAVTAERWSASCTPGATNVGLGIQNWAGQASGKGAFPVLLPDGTDVTFQGVVNNDAGEGALLSLNGTIKVEQLTIDINRETNAAVAWQATFGFQGIPTEAASGAADDTFADMTYPNAFDILVGGSTIASASLKIRTGQIVLRRPASTYIIDGATFRKASNLEADLSFSVFNSSLKVAAIAPNVLDEVIFSLTATQRWRFNKVRILGKSNYQVDRGSSAIIGYTVNAQWNSADDGEQGAIAYTLADLDDETFVYGVAL